MNPGSWGRQGVAGKREKRKKFQLLWDSLHFLITSRNYFPAFLTHGCRNCTIPSSALLCMFGYFYAAFPEVIDNMLTVGNTQPLTQTLWEHMYKNTFSTSLSVNLQPNVLRTNSNLLLSLRELEIHPWEKCLQSNIKFCFKQANDENKLAKGVQRQKEPVELPKPSGGKVGSLAHLQGWGRRQEWFLQLVSPLFLLVCLGKYGFQDWLVHHRNKNNVPKFKTNKTPPELRAGSVQILSLNARKLFPH